MATKTHSEKVLDLVEITGTIIEKTSSLIATKEAQDQKISKLIPHAVQALLDNERIRPHEKEAAEKVLSDPVRVLEVLIKTAAHRSDTELAKLGNPTEKSASHQKKAYNSLEDGYVGRRARPEEPESYKAFKRGLGL